MMCKEPNATRLPSSTVASRSSDVIAIAIAVAVATVAADAAATDLCLSSSRCYRFSPFGAVVGFGVSSSSPRRHRYPSRGTLGTRGRCVSQPCRSPHGDGDGRSSPRRASRCFVRTDAASWPARPLGLAHRRGSRGRAPTTATWLSATSGNDDDDASSSTASTASRPNTSASAPATLIAVKAPLSRRSSSAVFSIAMVLSGAMLGPLLDSYHSAFGVLRYDDPIALVLWGTDEYHPALVTSWWVPPLFGLAGFIIGWLYVLFDVALGTDADDIAIRIAAGTTINSNNNDTSPPPLRRRRRRRRPTDPSIPTVLCGISMFTFQYWLSGAMYAYGAHRTQILLVMSLLAAVGYVAFDATTAGFVVSAATALGGPLIEMGLITALNDGRGGYHYSDTGETGYFPLWILPVYFLGGPAVGNLARSIWNALSQTTLSDVSTSSSSTSSSSSSSSSLPTETNTTLYYCQTCNDTRCDNCPNCDSMGYYVTYGQRVQCNCCKGRGYVMCRACFDQYGDDPYDIDAIRNIMSKMPD